MELNPKIFYSLMVTPEQSDKLADWFEAHNWQFYKVDYAAYAYRQEGCNVVVYTNGKLVVQGKRTEEFVLNVIEVEITKRPQLGLEHLEHPEWFKPHAGLDESGKGDLLGPLVTACVIADGAMVEVWLQKGLKESKMIGSDTRLFQMDRLIRETKGIVIEIAYAKMEKYNQLYAQFKNLNKLLAWLHAKTLKKALKQHPVQEGLLDQFTTSKLVQYYLKSKNFKLEQRVRAESDPVVAAASVIARAEYIRQLQMLSQDAGLALPKGAGLSAKKALKQLIEKHGRENLPHFAKMHFKTVHEVTESNN